MINGIGALNLQQPVGTGSENTVGISPGVLTPPVDVDAGNSFAAMVNEATSRTIGTLREAEQVSVQALQGDADMRQVADAVMSAEQALQAAVAIRDKIVTAYLEISRMAI